LNGEIIHLNPAHRAAIVACETKDYMVIDFRKPGLVALGDRVDTQGLWFGETGELLDKASGRSIQVTVQCIVRDPDSAERECDACQSA
jgi:hypothetical protein